MPARSAEFRPAPIWSIGAAKIDPVAMTLDAIAGLNYPTHLRPHVEWCASPEHYSEAVFEIERRMNTRRRRFAERCCVENILGNAPLSIRIFRIARSFDLFEDLQDGRAIPALCPADFVASASDKTAAHMVLAVLGLVESAAGFVTIDETTADRPGFWPADERFRLALALHLIVRFRHGERPRWNLVRP